MIKKLNILIASAIFLHSACNAQKTSKETIGDPVQNLGQHLMLVFQDKTNNLWFGSSDEGVYLYNGKTALHFTEKHGLADNHIRHIQQDKSGNVYFTTQKGISKYDGHSFTTLPIQAEYTNEWKSTPDDLWFQGAIGADTIYRYDGKILHPLTLPPILLAEAYYAKYPQNGISPYEIYSIYTDTNGNVWFGTGSLGACRYNGHTFDWITEPDVTELHDGPSNGVRSIVEDKDGKFWFSKTLYRYEITAAGPFQYSREKAIGHLNGQENNLLHLYLSAVKDDQGALWFVTYANGVWRYDGEKITHYPVSINQAQVKLFSIFKDNQGVLWLGSHENGVFKFNGETFEPFTF